MYAWYSRRWEWFDKVDDDKWFIVNDNGSGLLRHKEKEHDINDDPTSLSFRGGKCSRTVSWNL